MCYGRKTNLDALVGFGNSTHRVKEGSTLKLEVEFDIICFGSGVKSLQCQLAPIAVNYTTMPGTASKG